MVDKQRDRYVIGVDLGIKPHRTAIAVVNASDGSVTELITVNSPLIQVIEQRIIDLVNTVQADAVWLDSGPHLGHIVAQWQMMGIPVLELNVKRDVKIRMFESLQHAIEHGDLEVPTQITDDEREALAIAWYGSTHSSSGISFV